MKMEQGAMIDCPYCTLVHPHLKGKPDCPYCHGRVTQFREARMMDRTTAELNVLEEIFCIGRIWGDTGLNPPNPVQLKDLLVNLLMHVELYQFDFRSALITQIQELDS